MDNLNLLNADLRAEHTCWKRSRLGLHSITKWEKYCVLLEILGFVLGTVTRHICMNGVIGLLPSLDILDSHIYNSLLIQDVYRKRGGTGRATLGVGPSRNSIFNVGVMCDFNTRYIARPRL